MSNALFSRRNTGTGLQLLNLTWLSYTQRIKVFLLHIVSNIIILPQNEVFGWERSVVTIVLLYMS